MGDRDPLVSVIIPTFNREAYLREAVGSVFAQTYVHWELIVADDGSTDGTRAYLASLNDPRVRVVALEHTGNPARVRNAALARAEGRYVAFLDDDDLWMSEKLALQIGDLLAHPERRWSYTRCGWVDQRGAVLPPPTPRQWRPYAGWILEPVILLDAWVAMPSVVVERDAMREIGGFDGSLWLCEDYDAWLKLAIGWQASVVDQPLTMIRVHPGNNTGRRVEALEQMVGLFRKLMANPKASSVRALSRRQYARMALDLADRLRGGASPARVLRALATAFVHRPADLRWWVVLLKTCLRPLMPPAAMRLYRALRNA